MSSLSFTTADQAFPEGTVAGSYQIQIENVAGTVINSQTTTATTITFTVAAGTYIAVVQLLDSNGNALGSSASSAAFTTVDPVTTVTLQVPLAVTVTP